MTRYRYKILKKFYSQGDQYVGRKRAKLIEEETRRMKRKVEKAGGTYEIPGWTYVRSHTRGTVYVDWSGRCESANVEVTQAQCTTEALARGCLALLSVSESDN